jgi:hypothetical protein
MHLAGQPENPGRFTPPSAWRRIARIWRSLYRDCFIKISSSNVPRKFYSSSHLIAAGLPINPQRAGRNGAIGKWQNVLSQAQLAEMTTRFEPYSTCSRSTVQIQAPNRNVPP